MRKNGAKATTNSGYGNPISMNARMPAWSSQAAITQAVRIFPPNSAIGAASSMAIVAAAANGHTHVEVHAHASER